MRRKISVRFIGLALLFFLPFLTHAQPYRKLSTRDFTGTPPNDGFAAYTYCYVSYSYQPTKRNGNYNIDFNVQLLMNPAKSWIRYAQVDNPNDLQDVLKHEQGHYNIAYLMRNELYSVFSRHRYTSNYQAEIVSLFREVDARYHKLNIDYETETQHMANIHNQQKWDLWFSRQLNNIEIASTY